MMTQELSEDSARLPISRTGVLLVLLPWAVIALAVYLLFHKGL